MAVGVCFDVRVGFWDRDFKGKMGRGKERGTHAFRNDPFLAAGFVFVDEVFVGCDAGLTDAGAGVETDAFLDDCGLIDRGTGLVSWMI